MGSSSSRPWYFCRSAKLLHHHDVKAMRMMRGMARCGDGDRDEDNHDDDDDANDDDAAVMMMTTMVVKIVMMRMVKRWWQRWWHR